MHIRLYTLFASFNKYDKKYNTGDRMLTLSDIFFQHEYSALVSDLWLNTTYIIINFHRNILLRDRAFGQHNALSKRGPYMAFRICLQRYN